MNEVTEKFEALGENKIIITTEKDAVRLDELDFQNNVRAKMYYLPVKVNFVFPGQEQEFNNQIFKYVTKDKTDYRLHTTVRQF